MADPIRFPVERTRPAWMPREDDPAIREEVERARERYRHAGPSWTESPLFDDDGPDDAA